jgi:thimet oligopeptidase
MPSQMLEEWMWDPAILKRVSKHYKTGEPLPDDMINHILSLRHFDSGYWLQRQAYFSLLSLYCFKEGAYKDIDSMHKKLFNRMFPYIQFTADNHDYASFGHLTGYAAKYYGYLWSKVFALDMFDYIKQYGLLNYEIGKRYVDIILSKGGSEDPEKMLVSFLGRTPRSDAFIKVLGL